jgi:AraC-like DNA-binding protein
MTMRIHHVEPYRTVLSGMEAMALLSNRSFPRHSHDQLGFGVLHRGRHRSWSGVGMVDAVSGDVICVNPGEVHDGASVGGQARAWRRVYLDPSTLVREIGDEIKERAEVVRPVLQDTVLARLFARLFACIAAPCRDELACEENLLRCLARLFREHGVRRPVAAGPSPALARALDRLHSQPDEPLSLGELAALSGVSRFKFLRAFARATGITPHAYQIQLRVRMAQRLLRAGRTVAEASLRAGFADQSHLTRCFTRQLGVTPNRYRAAFS